MKKHVLIGLIILDTLIVAGILLYFLAEPRSDRNWLHDLSKDTTAAFNEDGTVTITNIRDWSYKKGELVTDEWIESTTLRPQEVVRAWFVLEPFGEWDAVGHTYLTFEFKDGSAYSFSVEARREAHEGYSAFMGLWRQYELSYTWGTERDFLTRRLLYLAHPVRMYPLAANEEEARSLFVTLLERTNDVSAHPRFYHTLFANCTNVLAELANESAPGAVPYDISWNLPGLSDGFLMREGLIPLEGTIEETKSAYDVTPYKEAVADIAGLPHTEFSQALRTLPPFAK